MEIQISPHLVEKIDELQELGGYESRDGFVEDAVARRVREIEKKLGEEPGENVEASYPGFRYEVESDASTIEITLQPPAESETEIVEDKRSSLVLVTSETAVPLKDLVDGLNDVEKIEDEEVTKEAIHLIIPKKGIDEDRIPQTV
ncbi:MAG: ribbon-helix-helix domain-containing protein [Halobacteria archaeon]